MNKVEMPENDCDVILVFPSGKEITIQSRPSYADGDYAGSLDIILPECTCVICWKGDNMEPAPEANGPEFPHERMAKQLIIELP